MKKRLLFCLLLQTMCMAVMATIGALTGKFTINAAGDQIQFSQGNLQYQASTDTWQFAANQWSIFGSANVSGGGLADVIDLFGWGTGNNRTKTDDDPYFDYYNPNNNDPANFHYTTFVDWGANAISNGGNSANIWRTLTANEWQYLFTGRANAASLFALGRVADVNGLILLPDNWMLPSGVTIDNIASNAITSVDGMLTFIGTYEPVSIGKEGDNTILYLGAANKLYWPNGEMTIGCQRAYFQLNFSNDDESADPDAEQSLVRTIILNFGDDSEATGINAQATLNSQSSILSSEA